MKLPIPHDWDGETWDCFRVEIPHSDTWLALFFGMIEIWTQGRYWNENTGRVTDAQAIGREISRRNTPPRLCGGDTPAINEQIFQMVSGAIADSEDEDMPIYDITIDRTTGRLVKWLAPCCPAWVEYSDVQPADTGVMPPGVLDRELPQPGEPDFPELPEDIQDASACAKTHRLFDTIAGIVDTLLDGVNLDIPDPWELTSAVKSTFPYINFGEVRLFAAATEAISIAALGLGSEVEDPDVLQKVKCNAVYSVEPGTQGLSDSEIDGVFSAMHTVHTAEWTFADSPLPATMGNLWKSAFGAIGHGDIRKITTAVAATGSEDCSCPGQDTSDGEQDVGDAGYFMSRNYAELFEVRVSSIARYTAIHNNPDNRPIYGVVVKFNDWEPQNVVKRMVTSQEDRDAHSSEVIPAFSLWGDTSDHLENDAVQYGNPLVCAGSGALRVAIGTYYGHPLDHIYAPSTWFDENGDNTNLPFSLTIQESTDQALTSVKEFRLIYHHDDD